MDHRSLDVDLVLLALLEAPALEVRGRELGLSTGLDTGRTHRATRALEDRAWITVRVEEPLSSSNRRRVFYGLTETGRGVARDRTGNAGVLRAVSPGWSAVEWRRDELARRDALITIRDLAAGVITGDLAGDARVGITTIHATAERLLRAWPTPSVAAPSPVTAAASGEVA